MHTYASDSNDRIVVPGALALMAVAVAYVINLIVGYFKLGLPWFIDAPTVMGAYGGLHWLYNSRLWRARTRNGNLSPIPDLNGHWEGRLISSFETEPGKHVEKVCRLSIHQTWSSIMVLLNTDTSRSWSTMAAVYSRESPHFGLKYDYTNKPTSVLADDKMEEHCGTAQLLYSRESDTLNGDYYNGRGRQTYGRFEFRRVSRDVS